MQKSEFNLLTDDVKLEIFQKYSAGEWTIRELAQKFDLTPKVLYKEMHRLGIRPHTMKIRLGARTSVLHDVPIDMWSDCSLYEIAKAFDVSYQQAYNFRKRYKEVLDDEIRRYRARHRNRTPLEGNVDPGPRRPQ